MRVLVVRHASAGDRRRWSGDDGLRPLDKKGRRQAKALRDTLADLGTGGLYSSPYLRCVQTLEPAATFLGLPLEVRDELAEGSTRDDVLRLLGELEAESPALSTHGDVIERLLPGTECKKGAIWIVDVRGDDVRPERYLPPPA